MHRWTPLTRRDSGAASRLSPRFSPTQTRRNSRVLKPFDMNAESSLDAATSAAAQPTAQQHQPRPAPAPPVAVRQQRHQDAAAVTPPSAKVSSTGPSRPPHAPVKVQTLSRLNPGEKPKCARMLDFDSEF